MAPGPDRSPRAAPAAGGAAAPGHPLTVAQVARMIDHSLLRPELTPDDVAAGCALAAAHAVAGVCVKPADVPQAVAVLGTAGVLASPPAPAHAPTVAVCTVIGFPHGGTTTAVKVAESRDALAAGAIELDMVLNIGRLRGGGHGEVLAEVRAVAEVAHEAGALLKVILENAYLTDDEKRAACRLSEEAGAHFVKTSTGFAPGGATLADVILMRASVGPSVQVKAAGGVRTLDTLLAMVAEGATRFGATATAEILAEAAVRAGTGSLRVPDASHST
ncbi:MAG TPA: deoxyribose-phosphate aldolase [Acidimicrobiales bacterium]|nr:deoxyribose-phosphate aldolase [Acidimicrobiales bacterium]